MGGRALAISRPGCAGKGYDLYLVRYGGEGWRCTFYETGREHSLTSTTGSAWEKTPWLAVQRAAARALDKTDVERVRLPVPSR
jgi:hypothetical protein